MASPNEFAYTPGYNAMWPGNVYPETGDSTGLVGTFGGGGAAPGGLPLGPGAATNSGAVAGGNPFMGNPLGGAIVMVVLIFVIGLLVHRFGEPKDDFSNIKASLYNGGIIALVAVTFIPLVKFGTLKLASLGIPGMDHVSAYVMGA